MVTGAGAEAAGAPGLATGAPGLATGAPGLATADDPGRATAEAAAPLPGFETGTAAGRSDMAIEMRMERGGCSSRLGFPKNFSRPWPGGPANGALHYRYLRCSNVRYSAHVAAYATWAVLCGGGARCALPTRAAISSSIDIRMRGSTCDPPCLCVCFTRHQVLSTVPRMLAGAEPAPCGGPSCCGVMDH